MKKNYATSMCFNNTCMLKRDYSYIINGKCLDCKFCYRHAVPGTKSKVRSATMLEFEEKCSPHLYKVPVTISRYCDPYYSEGSLRNSRAVARRVIAQGGQLIWKSAKASFGPMDFYMSPNAQMQGRIITADTKTGTIVRKMIAPNFDSTFSILTWLGAYRDLSMNRMDVAISFDPLILGLNDADLYIVAQQAAQRGLKKIIVKQLFATDYFKAFLASNVGKDCSNLLTEKVGPFWTYKSELLLQTMHGVLQDTQGLGIEFSMCSNKDINSLLNDSNNCCLFNDPKGIYDIAKTGKGKESTIIDLKDK